MDALLLAYSLSGAAGVRSALVLFVIALSIHFGRLHPDPSLLWAGSWWIILFAAAAAAADFLGDKIPVLDHALHVVHMVLAPVVGAISAASGYRGDPTTDLAIAALGAGNALLVHATRTGIRAASSVTTLGLANPLISVVEDLGAAGFIFLALLVPALTASIVAGATICAIWMLKKAKRLAAARRLSSN